MLAIDYLGRSFGELLQTPPFSDWRVVRTVENEPTHRVCYEFDGHGVEVACDGLDRIQTVFLHRGDGESLVDVSFAMGRTQVIEQFGVPSKSGGPSRIPGLGDRGAWDRFMMPGCIVHVQYAVGRDQIDMVTLMRPDAVPL